MRDVKPLKILGKRYYTISDVAKMLGLSYRTIWEWIKKGKLPAKRLGKKYLISHDSLTRLLE